ncbi:MAG: hypothetical protein ACJ8F7_05170 [Gemmataceae bacterium]
MHSACRILLSSAWLLIPFAAQGQEAYTIKLSKPEQPGDRCRQTIVKTDTMAGRILDTNGNALRKNNERKTINSVCVEKILAKEAGKRSTKLTQTYEKAIMFAKGTEIDVGLAGRTVTIEYADKKYKFTYENGDPVTGPAEDFLKDEFKDRDDDTDGKKMEVAMLPKKPVKVGETWKCDVDALIKGFGADMGSAVDPKKTTANGKLLKAYVKDDRQYGVVEVHMEVALTRMGKGDQAIKMVNGAVMRATVTLDGAIDGGREEGVMSAKLTIRGDGKITGPDGNDYDVKLEVTTNGTNTRKPVK